MKNVILCAALLFTLSCAEVDPNAVVREHIVELPDGGEKNAAAMLAYFMAARCYGIEEQLLNMVSEFIIKERFAEMPTSPDA